MRNLEWERQLFALQAEWLEPARSRLFRKVEIARRKSVLDLGCGYGAVTTELQRRCPGTVIALDRSPAVLCHRDAGAANLVCADALALPFDPGTFDLVVSQNVMAWVGGDSGRAAAEVQRVMRQGGCWVLIEPDYGGMMEYPPEIETRPIWLSAVLRAGGDPLIGRKLPTLLQGAGFQADVELLSRLLPASPRRFEFPSSLPLDERERARLTAAEEFSNNCSQQVCHLPYYLIIACRNSER